MEQKIDDCGVMLPIFTECKLLRELREKKYMEEGMSLYPNVQEGTVQEYEELKEAFINNDSTAMSRLMELSIFAVIESVAKIYAKYDLDEVLPYSEAVSCSLDRFYKYSFNFKSLPNNYCSFKTSLISYYVFKFVRRQYKLEFARINTTSVQKKENVIWQIDHNESEEFNGKHIILSEVRKSLNKVFDQKLTKNQLNALSLRYGLNDDIQRSFTEVANELNLSRARAKDLVDRALKNIRKNQKKLNVYSDCNLEI